MEITRRDAIRMGAISGAALLMTDNAAPAAEARALIFADEKAVLFKIRNVTLNKVNEPSRTVTMSFGKKDRPTKLESVPLAEDVTIRVSFIEPGSVNNVPFDWDRLKGLAGKVVSVMLIAESSGLAVHSFATAND
jgi:hypothetical protein